MDTNQDYYVTENEILLALYESRKCPVFGNCGPTEMYEQLITDTDTRYKELEALEEFELDAEGNRIPIGENEAGQTIYQLKIHHEMDSVA